MKPKPRRGAWWLLVLLLILPPVARCEAAAPNLVGIWQGLAPDINTNGCGTEKLTVTITQQCGNLFRGQVGSYGVTLYEVVGRITDGTGIYLHGNNSGYMLILMGEYLAGSPPKIHVTYLYDGAEAILQTIYDTFDAAYSGKVPTKGKKLPLELLLTNQ